MLKKIFILICTLFCWAAHSAQIVNAEYIHNAIANKWDITIPYNSELSNPRVAANMKYLLTAIDVANKMLGGDTGYGDGEYATDVAADTVAADTAVESLIVVSYPFNLTTVEDTTSFSFSISASGIFGIDWGDGATEIINKANTDNITYSHDYALPGAYNIKIGGRATGYNSGTSTAAISFSGNTNLMGIDGCLGCVFSTLADGKQPRFYNTFKDATNLAGKIPENLFVRVSGKPADFMFYNTFRGCSGLTGEIPDNLFVNISGVPAKSMFYHTFSGCGGLSGKIPTRLFGVFNGAPASGMFRGTFYNCSGLTGEIPDNLFGNISGAPAEYMFRSTFNGCSGLTGEIPENLFAGISGAPAADMFYHTFGGCSGLTGEISPGLLGKFNGVPASQMFRGTFYNCSGLTGEIPENLFAGISGAPVESMFRSTFNGCSGLTGESAKTNGEYLYNLFTTATSSDVNNMYYGCTGLSDYDDIPDIWK